MSPTGPLTLNFRPGLRLTDRAFWKLCRANPELRLERTAEGGLVVMAPAAPDSSHRNAGITGQLWAWNHATRLGVVFDSSAAFTLPNTAIRGPDAAWMTRERWDALAPAERQRFSQVCPDFVAELRPKSDSKAKARRKMREYTAQGVRLGGVTES